MFILHMPAYVLNRRTDSSQKDQMSLSTGQDHIQMLYVLNLITHIHTQ